MREAVIVSTARTPLTKSHRGEFNATPGPQLAAYSVKAAVERSGIDPELIERALEVSGEKTKKAAVTKALQEVIARRQQKRLLDLVGGVAARLAGVAVPVAGLAARGPQRRERVVRAGRLARRYLLGVWRVAVDGR